LGRKRDPELLRTEEVIPSKKHIETFDLGLLFYIFPFSISTSWIRFRTPKKKRTSIGMLFPD